MAVEIDPLYKQNLTEWIYDEHKLITYRFLSVAIGVHVNIAKQMLYEFYHEERVKQTQKKKHEGNNNNGTSDAEVQALFYVSGIKSNAEVSGGQRSFSTTICRDDQIDMVKGSFLTLSSVHIYSVQLLDLESNHVNEKLSAATQETSLLKDMEGRSEVEFGPFQIQQPLEAKSVPKPITVAVSAPSKKLDLKSKAKVEVKKPEVAKKDFFGNSKKAETAVKKTEPEDPQTAHVDKQKDKPIISTSKNKEKSGKNSGSQTDRLKNMFAAAASIPRRPAKVTVTVVESESDEEDFEPEPKKVKASSVIKKEPRKTYGKSSASASKVKKVDTSRKRKRIVDILSSSEGESEDESRSAKRANLSSDEDDALPESPIPRRRAQIIESDSDEELSQESPVKRGPLGFAPRSKTPPPEVSGDGKKRVKKMVSRTYKDEDGYMVTKKEPVWVSASESDGDEEKPGVEAKVPAKGTSAVKEKVKVNLFTCVPVTNKNPVTPPAPSGTKKKPTPVPSKTKQSSLMSFFKKKD